MKFGLVIEHVVAGKFDPDLIDIHKVIDDFYVTKDKSIIMPTG